MNYSFINNYTTKDFIPQNPNNLYNEYDINTQYKKNNYYWSSHQQNKDNWTTENSIQKTLLKGLQEPTPIGELYFSYENINRIQKMIRYEIFRRTNGKYKLETDQNETDLLVVMRDVYLSCCNNMPYRVIHQVKELNQKTIEKIIPDMISMIKQDNEYIKKLDTPIEPIPLPICMNSKGRLSLPSVTTTFNYR